jgi:hypothetical protein
MFMGVWSIVFLLFLMVALNFSLSVSFCFSTPGVYEYRHSKQAMYSRRDYGNHAVYPVEDTWTQP